MKKIYASEFYQDMNEGKVSNLTSAQVMVPYILSLFPEIKSVVDMGCGTGAWLSVFKERGVEDILGIDGGWLDKKMLLIPEKNFLEHDLEKKIKLERKYDLALSFEVAEHVSEASAEAFVDSLVELSDVIIFSAAIPNQGGTHHVNEQWQSYWKNKFEKQGYVAFDPIRGKFAKHPKCLYFYSQNMLVYVKKDKIADYPQMNKFIGLPFVVDLKAPLLTLDNTPKSWKYLIRQQGVLCKTAWRKLLHQGEYSQSRLSRMK